MTVYSAGLIQRRSLEQSSSRSSSHDCLATGSVSTGSLSTGSLAWRRLVIGLAVVCWAMMWGANLPGVYAAEQRLAVLFLGDQGHHQPKARFDQLQPVLAARGIDLTYTSALTDLNSETLAHYPVLILYANIDEIGAEQARALLEYVAKGGGFVPLHCASYCFRNNPEVVALMGAQFQRHGTGTFRTQPAGAEHPVMRGFGGFESWDETYVHHLHNEKDRTVLEYRVDSEGREPWTWVRTHGEGRVFYTAWGHDQRTWSKPGFHNLVERGIRWAAKQDPELAGQYRDAEAFPVPQMTELRTDAAPFEFQDVGAKIPNYTPGQQWGTQGAPLTKMQLPLPAEESIKHFVTPQGFHVELFVSDPMLEGKPICMTWDERGRLWVAETYDYPNELQPPGKGRDRIRICEDTDGDGKADKTTVFADKLSIPTSIAFSRGGVIIQDGMNTLYLKDTNGDDQADQREVLFSGWGMGDTHGGVSNFQYGLDNWIWGMQGYNDSSPVVKGEPQQSFRQGFFRFRPDGSQLEFIRSTNNNTWGLGISEEGIIFGSTANRNPSVYMPIPNRFYERVRGWTPSMVLDTIADTYLFKAIRPDIRQVDQHGGYTAGAGHALYTARSYPQEYWNRTAFVTEPTGHLVGTFVLNRHGSDYKSTSPFNLLASNDEWSAPIMAEVGPDGSVWVLDWYNYIVQHNPTPHGFETGKGNAYETDLRDKKHGRVYRVVYDGAAKHAPLNLAQASPAELVAALKHPTMLWRKHAQRLLVERGELDIVPQLIALVQDQQVDEVGLNVGAIHALWTLEGLQALQDLQGPAGKAALAALRHPSAGVRRNAVQVLPPNASSVAAILQAGVVADADAQVQLASLLALAEQPASEGDEVGTLLVQRAQATDLPTDRWSSDALVAAAATHHAAFLRSAITVSQPSRRLEEAMRVVVGHWVRSQPDPQLLTALLKSATDNPSPLTTALVDGLADNWQANQPLTLSEEFEGALERLVPKVPAATQGRLVYLAKLWHSDRLDSYGQQITDQLLEQVADAARSAEERATAAQQLIEFSGDDASTTARLLELITPATEPELANQLLRTMSGARHDQAGQQLIERLNQLTPGLRTAAFTVLLSRPAMTRALLEATRDGQVQVDDLPLDQRQALLTHPDRALRRLAEEVFRNAVGLPSADRKAVLEEWLPVAGQAGSVEAGALVFRQQCAKCHMYRQEGNRIGPELTGMAVHPKSELLTNILDPSRSVEGNFRLYTVVTIDGRVLSGMLAAESRTTVEIFDAEGKRQTILRSDVEQLVGSNKSLMPEGFEKQISQQQMADLLAFLTQRGKYVPLDLAKVATISSARGMFFSPDSPIERMIFSDWSPKTFQDIPFSLVDPLDGRRSNAILLYGPEGTTAPKMPRSVEMPCETEAVAIHFLSGVSGWGHPNGRVGDVSLIVRIHYQDQQTEDHALKNGEHFADYIRRVDVPKSEFAFDLDGRQLRYFSVKPGRAAPIAKLELVKGSDRSAPIVMAITVETPTAAGK